VIESALVPGATATVALDFLVESALLVAVTVTLVLPLTTGAVNMPLLETTPALEDQVTAVLLVPCTVAANCWALPDVTLALFGETDTVMVDPDGTTETVALELFVASAWLVALTITVVLVVTAGAVKIPPSDTVPALADQLTLVLVVPSTVAENG
jgi:hypothetical protein